MSDNLKKYVEKNPTDFDIYSFDHDSGWRELSERIGTKSLHRPNRWLTVAAASVIFLMGMASVLVYQNSQRASVASELFETESYYRQMVDSKLSSLKGKVDVSFLIEDFTEMDKAFLELKEDLKDDVDNEEVVEAMINNYRLKLKILERIMIEIEEKDNESKYSDS